MAEVAAAAWRRTSPPPPPPPTTNQPQPATMEEEAAAAGATPLLEGLPDEIVLWEILVRLDPKSLLRCRAVRRAWRCASSARRFLLAHHARQPSLPIVFGDGYRNILAFDHRASADTQLHTITPLDEDFLLEASCDGLLILSKFDYIAGFRTYLSVCNLATRQHASFKPLSGFDILGMYPHNATVYVGKMDPHGPGGGPGWGGPTGWGLGGRGSVPPGGPGFPGVPRPGSWGPGFGGFFGSCFYLLCCCCLLQDCCGPLFGHPGPGGPPPPF